MGINKTTSETFHQLRAPKKKVKKPVNTALVTTKPSRGNRAVYANMRSTAVRILIVTTRSQLIRSELKFANDDCRTSVKPMMIRPTATAAGMNFGDIAVSSPGNILTCEGMRMRMEEPIKVTTPPSTTLRSVGFLTI